MSFPVTVSDLDKLLSELGAQLCVWRKDAMWYAEVKAEGTAMSGMPPIVGPNRWGGCGSTLASAVLDACKPLQR